MIINIMDQIIQDAVKAYLQRNFYHSEVHPKEP